MIDARKAESGGQSRPNFADIDFGNYYALIIGNNDYPNFPNLESAVNDARQLNQLLQVRYGFQTRLLINATRYQILSALNELRARLTPKDNLLIYYAGHGELDRVNLRGHWIPVDAEPDNTANWISNIAITDILNVIAAKHVLVVADSCYSGALTRSSMARISPQTTGETRYKWMTVMNNTRSRTVLTSGGLKPVLDIGKDGHSVFAGAFLKVLQDNADVLDGYKLFRELVNDVRDTAARYQVDQEPLYAPIKFAGHEAGEFFFVPKSARLQGGSAEVRPEFGRDMWRHLGLKFVKSGYSVGILGDQRKLQRLANSQPAPVPGIRITVLPGRLNHALDRADHTLEGIPSQGV